MIRYAKKGGILYVLMVEDSANDAELTERALKDFGFNAVCRVVYSEHAMRQALQEEVWDIVLSDFNLPSFSVDEAHHILQESAPNTPFLVVSGAIGEENVVSLMHSGIYDFVMKNNLNRLGPVIEHALSFSNIQSEYREVIQSLKDNEKLLKSVTSVLGEGLLVQNMHGELMVMNPEAERLLGWRSKEFRDKDVFNTIYWQEPDSPKVDFTRELIRIMRTKGGYKTEEDVFICKNGLLMPVSFVVTPLLENGEIVAVVMAFQDISLRKQAEVDLYRSRENLRDLSAHLQSVREEERSRISRELHDGLGQMLATIKLDAQWIKARQPADNSQLLMRSDSMIDLIDRTVSVMRRMAADMRPVMLDDLGLSAALDWLTEEVTEHSGLKIQLQIFNKDIDEKLNDEVKTALYRITQECLTNIVRHANAKQVMISLSLIAGKLKLMVSDDGYGIDVRKTRDKHSYGMIGMQERVYALEGTLNMNSIDGEGLSIEVEIPIPS